MAEPSTCDCLGCAIREAIEDRYDKPYDADDLSEITTLIAAIAGEILALANDDGAEQFCAAVVQNRTHRRKRVDLETAGGLQ